jgi:hypothetical protein
MKNEHSGPEVASFEQTFGEDPPIIHCPICGQATLDGEEGNVTPCSHLVFIYVAAAGDYAFKSEDFEQRTRDIDDENDGVDGIQSLLNQAGYGKNLLALSITYGGMACGPVWYTDVYGFELG